jgi:hypothetical protein
MPDASGICLSVRRLAAAVGFAERAGGGEMKSDISGTSRQPGASATSSVSGREEFALVGAGR